MFYLCTKKKNLYFNSNGWWSSQKKKNLYKTRLCKIYFSLAVDALKTI